MSFPSMTIRAWMRYDRIRALLPTSGGHDTFLEIGCGLGALGCRLARQFDYTAYEMDPRSAECAAEKIGPEGTVLSEELPLTPDRQFDLVGAFEVLEHMEHDRAALVDWGKWLRPGGSLLLSVPAHPHRFGASDVKAGHYRRYSREGLRAILQATGLQHVTIWSYGFPITSLTERIRNVIAQNEIETESMGQRTADSGRWLQIPDQFGLVTEAITLPFRYLQRPLVNSELGLGWVARAQKPDKATPLPNHS